MTNHHGGTGGGVGGPTSTADVKLRLVASAVTAILSVALLFFLVYRLRKRKLANREEQRRRRHDDEISVESIVADHRHPHGHPGSGSAYPMTVIHPPHNSSSGGSGSVVSPPRHSYWHSWAWWKPATTEIFEARPAPPTYDEAMMNVGGGGGGAQLQSADLVSSSRHADTQAQHHHQGNSGSNCECSSIESNGSEAPPYSEIHLDPVISEPSEWYRQQELQQQQHRPATLPCGAALVLPVPAQPFPHLNHVGTLPSRLRQADHHRRAREDDEEEEITPHLARPRSQQSGRVSAVNRAATATATQDLATTLPHVIRRMRARSREGIVLPPEERDAVLQRFSLQLNLNISSSGSSSSTLNTMSPERQHRGRQELPPRVQDNDGNRGGISPSSSSSNEHY